MKKKIVCIFVCMLLIITVIIPFTTAQFTKIHAERELQKFDKKIRSENETARVCIKIYDPKQGKFVYEPLKEISLGEAEQLKDELQNSWERDCPLDEKFKEQFFLLKNANVLPSNFSLEDVNELIEKVASKKRISEKTQDTTGLVLNFCSFLGVFTLFSTTAFGWLLGPGWSKYFYLPDPPISFFGYNVTCFLQYAVCGIVAPFHGFGYVSTFGLFGQKNLPGPASFLGFVFGFAGIWLALQGGNPLDSIFEIILGVTGISVFMPTNLQ